MCNHYLVCPIETDAKIKLKNRDKNKKYTIAKAVWELEGKQTKSSAPRKPKYISQQLACMCIVSKCRDSTTGRGCIQCESIAKSFGYVPYNAMGTTCICEVCACNCRFLFDRNNHSKLERDIVSDRRFRTEKSKGVTPKKRKQTKQEKQDALDKNSLKITEYFFAGMQKNQAKHERDQSVYEVLNQHDEAFIKSDEE